MSDFTFSEQRQIAKQDQADDDRVQAEKNLYDDFMKAAINGDMAAVATFAPMTTDFKAPYVNGFTRPMRLQTVGEVLTGALEYSSPTYAEAMALLCELAFTQQPGCALEQKARELLERMAWRFADMNVEGQL